jgi:hypothetical protein
MRLKIQTMAFLGIAIMLMATFCAGQAQAADIEGRISLANPSGEVFFGDWVRVYLTTKPIDVPAVELASVDIAMERRSRINSGHMDFYVNFRQRQEDTGYIVDNKLTRPDGTFAFHQIRPGRYYVLVTFPTMIAGFKCAWQVAVDVVEGHTIEVELDNHNLALPAY